MDNDEFKLNETGINPVDTASENNDVYFTNVKAEKNNEQSKIIRVDEMINSKVALKKIQKLLDFIVTFAIGSGIKGN